MMMMMPGAKFRFGEGPPYSEEFLFEATMAIGYEARQDLPLVQDGIALVSNETLLSPIIFRRYYHQS